MHNHLTTRRIFSLTTDKIFIRDPKMMRNFGYGHDLIIGNHLALTNYVFHVL